MNDETKNVTMGAEGAEMPEAPADGAMTPPVSETPVATGHVPAALRGVYDLLVRYGLTETALEAAKPELDKLGVESTGDLVVLRDEELASLGLKPAKARRMIEELKNRSDKGEAETMADASAPAQAVAPTQMTLLKQLPAEDAWLSSLKEGGILKVGQSSLNAAMRAAIADVVNVKAAMDKLCALIERHYEDDNSPVPQIYFDIKKESRRRGKYREVLDLINGGSGSGVTNAQRVKAVNNVRTILFPALYAGQQALTNWYKLYEASMVSNAYVNMGNMGGARMPGMLPPIMQIPDMGVLRDAADAVRNAANRALAGTSSAAACTIAVDYKQIQEVLERPNLAAECGCASREQLLTKLGIGVPSSLIRMERTIVQYAVSFFASDEVEQAYEAYFWSELYNLGTQIDFNALINLGKAREDTAQAGEAEDDEPVPDPFTSVTGKPVR